MQRRFRSIAIVLAIACGWSASASFAGAASTGGWLDPTFAGRGYAVVPRGPNTKPNCGSGGQVAIAPTGRVFVLVYRCGTGLDHPSEVTVYDAAGRLDRAFNGGRPLAAFSSDIGGVTVILPTADGGFLAHLADCCPYSAIRAFDARGRIDTGYGLSGGRSLPRDIRAGYEHATVVVRLAGGSVRACLNNANLTGTGTELSGLTPNGAIDTRIGPAGYRDMGIPECHALGVDSAGRLYWVSRRWLAGPRGVIDVFRMNHTGTIDASWGTAGLVTIEDPARHLKPALREISVASDGSIYVGLGASAAPSGSPWTAGVAKLTPAGTMDASFGTNGIADVAPVAGTSRLVSIAVDGSGRPLLSLVFSIGGRPDPVLTRLTAVGGSPDPTYGIGGIVHVANTAQDISWEPRGLVGVTFDRPTVFRRTN